MKSLSGSLVLSLLFVFVAACGGDPAATDDATAVETGDGRVETETDATATVDDTSPDTLDVTDTIDTIDTADAVDTADTADTVPDTTVPDTDVETVSDTAVETAAEVTADVDTIDVAPDVGPEVVAPFCGDRHTDPGEECDDGNDVLGDGCEPDCALTGCADADGDAVCDDLDQCPGHDDRVDQDDDRVPDGCDVCAGDDTLDDDADGRPDACDCDAPDVCPASATCREDTVPAVVTCTCLPGYRREANRCVDVNECVTASCDPLAGCVNTPGSFHCGVCPVGFSGSGDTQCRDIDECTTNNGGCDARTTCANVVGGRVCGACPAGFEGSGASGCVDIDECSRTRGNCNAIVTCTNTPGAFTCGACPAGYTGNGIGPNGCADIDECATANGGCDPNAACINTAGASDCGPCPSGFTGHGKTGCVDVDECVTNNGGCDPLTTCTNTIGAHNCGACPSGYTGNGATGCIDVDECRFDNGGCDRLTLCTNVPGARTCGACPQGYSGSGATQCEDIDECTTNNGGCDALTTCTNTIGGRACGACPAGYDGDGVAGCADINECLNDNGGCDPFVTCTNTPGARTCGACPDGFTGDGVTGCSEGEPLAEGSFDRGGATQAEHDQLRASWVPQLPPDQVALTPRPGVETATEAQANDVIVRPDSLTFDATAHPEVGEWAPGKIIVSQPAAGAAKNPFGFMRRVTNVARVGAEFVVATTLPALEEVFTGELQMEFDASTARVVGWDEFDHAWAVKNLYNEVGLLGEHYGSPLPDDEPWPDDLPLPIEDGAPFCCSGIVKAVTKVASVVTSAAKAVASAAVAVYKAIVPASFTGDLRLDRELRLGAKTGVLSYNFSKKWRVKDDYFLEAAFEGRGDFDGSITFNPRTSFGMRIPNPLSPDAPNFRVWLDIDAYLNTSVVLNLALAASIRSAGGGPASDLEAAVRAGEEAATTALTYFKAKSLGDADTKPAGGWKKTLYVSQPSTQWIMAGPVPVVFTQTFQLDLECGFEVRATLDAHIEHHTSRVFRFRAEYEKGGNSSISPPYYDSQVSRNIQITGGGEANVSCGLIPRVNAYLYDAIGVNVGLRASAIARATYTSTCEADPLVSRPKGDITLGLYGNVGIQFGGRIQAPGSSYAGASGQNLGFDVGPYELWTKNWPIIERSWAVGGIGYCTPTCRNGSTSGSEKETDVDCGNMCPTQCAPNKKCGKNSDCTTGYYCTNGTCTDNHCLDGVRTHDESGTDCGGNRCEKCAVDRACFKNSDCQSNACRKRSGYGAVHELGICVSDPCQDAQESPGECAIDCGGGCDLCDLGVACETSAGCASGVSNGYMCVPGTCANLKRDGSETDVDCGGGVLCGRCRMGMTCKFDSDCDADAPVCDPTRKVCAKALCMNGSKDPNEGDVDCGKGCADKCDVGQTCNTTFDCDAGLECNAGMCAAPTCSDAWKARAEGDVDCGKGCDERCENGETCNVAKDCASDICSKGRCAATDCFDRLANGLESDVDCGGDCARCDAGELCGDDDDCQSRHCAAGTCAVASCGDGIVNQNETDEDCGGVCGGCATGELCQIGGDCVDRRCVDGLCAAPACDDLATNGSESDVDCGGTCTPCASGLLCTRGEDCETGACLRGICADARCGDGVANGSESDVDCGGECPARCEVDQVCDDPSDCTTSSCGQNVCLAATCEDAILNGTETATDCGGACTAFALRCVDGQACAADVDCTSRHCMAEVCVAARCDDGRKNGDEVGVDCGGSCASGCGPVRIGGVLASQSAQPTNLVASGGRLFFFADDGVIGRELYVKDDDGTRLVADLRPGASGSVTVSSGMMGGAPTYPSMVAYRDGVAFVADDGVHGATLWTSNGSSVVMVKEIRAGGNPGVSNLTVFGDRLVFTANDGSNGNEPWVSDGSAAGTTLLRDITSGGNSDVANVRAAAELVYFTVGLDLWVSDGTTVNTTLVKAGIRYSSSAPFSGVTIGNNLYFNGSQSFDSELWSSDGTSGGTLRIADIRPGSTGSAPSNMVVRGSEVFFTADDGTTGRELWKSNGVSATRVADVAAGTLGLFVEDVNLVVVGDVLLFVGYADGGYDFELWKSDGTAGGTSLVKDLDTGKASRPDGFTVADGKAWFFASDGVGRRLWSSDGTTAGTQVVTGLYDGNVNQRDPAWSATLDDVAFLGAANGLADAELYAVTADAVAIVSDLNVNPPTLAPAVLVPAGDKVYFEGYGDATGEELWASAGGADSAAIVVDGVVGVGGSGIESITAAGAKVMYIANVPANNRELWVSDGSANGTHVTKELVAGAAGANLMRDLNAVGGLVFFSANPEGKHEVWRSDGTADGTFRTREIAPAQLFGSVPARFTVLGNKLFFTATDNNGDRELWESDGTSGGTVRTKDLDAGLSSNLFDLTTAGDRFYFVSADTAPAKLWRSDGTSNGTVVVRTLDGTFGGAANFVRALGATYMSANSASGNELWRTDDTAGGTVLVKDIRSGNPSSSPKSLTAFDGRVFFSADDGVHGRELWVSDGTAEGTTLFMDLYPGAASGVTESFVVLGDHLYFMGNDGDTGAELWRTDGTVEGTTLVHDLNPLAGSYPSGLVVHAGELWFIASSGGPRTVWRYTPVP